MDLAELFNKYGSDKDINGYSRLYHTLFDKIKDEPMHIAEIGIGTMIAGVRSSMVGYSRPNYAPGGSLRAWRDYFTTSQLYGFDVQPDTQFEEDRIKTILCDSTSPDSVERTINALHHVKFDIIIDDGDHAQESQFETLKNFYPHLKDGGFYIIEDVYIGSLVSTDPTIVRQIVNNDPFFFSGIRNNLCVIYKKPLSSSFANY